MADIFRAPGYTRHQSPDARASLSGFWQNTLLTTLAVVVATSPFFGVEIANPARLDPRYAATSSQVSQNTILTALAPVPFVGQESPPVVRSISRRVAAVSQTDVLQSLLQTTLAPIIAAEPFVGVEFTVPVRSVSHASAIESQSNVSRNSLV